MDLERLRKELGVKLTPQRLAIIEFLDGNKSHPSAEDIYKALKPKFPSMSFTTVYNTLELLQKKGLLRVLVIQENKLRFDPDVSPHHHFICKKCGKIIDIKRSYDFPLPEEIKDCEILDVQVNFIGYCQECKKEKN